MKTLLFIIALFGSLSDAESKNEIIYTPAGDSLIFNWEIKSYEMGNKVLPFSAKIFYSNGVWYNALEQYFSHYSDDNLETWIRAPFAPVKSATDFTVTKNKAFVIGDSSGKGSWGLIAETEDIHTGWTVKTHDIFKNVYIRRISFKDESIGIISSAYDIYRTEDGGQNWNKTGNFSSFFNGDEVFIERFLSSNECDLLIAVAHPLNDLNPYFFLSKDYGKSWIGPRTLPIKCYSNAANPATTMSCYIRNDSLWLGGNIGYNNGSGYQYIFFTTDLGVSWTTQYLYEPSGFLSTFSSIQFFDNSLIGMACESNPFVYLTFDGGSHWFRLSDSVTYYSKNYNINPEDTLWRDLTKYKVVKAENKMYFFGWNKVFKFNNLNVPKGVNEYNPGRIYCEYDSRSQSIYLHSKSDDILEGVALYDETGRELYQIGASSQSHLQILHSQYGGARIVFAIISVNGEVFLKKLLCE